MKKLLVFLLVTMVLLVGLMPAAVSAQGGDCSVAPSSYLHVGDTVMIAHAFLDLLQTNQMQVYTISNGDLYDGGFIRTGNEYEILEGPNCIGGRRYWRISQGWVPDGYTDTPLSTREA